MSIDPESTTFWQFVAGVLGLGGGGSLLGLHKKVAEHSIQIDALKTDRVGDAKKIDETHTTVTTLAANVTHMQNDISAIHHGISEIKSAVESNGRLYVARRKQHIVDSGGEVDE